VDKTKYAYTTPRTLLGIIRLAQGVAKLRFSTEVNQDDIREAMRLMDSSQETLKPDQETLETKKSNGKTDKMTKVFNIVKSIVPPDGKISLKDLENQVVSRGINLNDLEAFLETYSRNEMILYSKENDFMHLI
jgi:DNA replication licensing factor MCM7